MDRNNTENGRPMAPHEQATTTFQGPFANTLQELNLMATREKEAHDQAVRDERYPDAEIHNARWKEFSKAFHILRAHNDVAAAR